MRPAFFLLLIITGLISCSNYKQFQSRYQFKSPEGLPDYGDLNYWAAHPYKWDPSDSIPAPLLNETRDSMVDVFFIHPTTYTINRKQKAGNALIDDAEINAKTDYSTILYQASVFNNQCRVFAPRYRQAHISNFFSKDTLEAAVAFDSAYADISQAFKFYLQQWNGHRPIIIAGHSQGALMAERLLKDYFENTLLTNRLVAAYIIGWQIPPDYFTTLGVCKDSLQTGCINGWRTLRTGFLPRYVRNLDNRSLVTNPLNWTTTSDYAAPAMNRGSVLKNYNKIYTQTTGALISNSFLYVRKPKFPGGFFYFTRNYHIADINLFYMNIREDVRRRIGLFWKQ